MLHESGNVTSKRGNELCNLPNFYQEVDPLKRTDWRETLFEITLFVKCVSSKTTSVVYVIFLANVQGGPVKISRGLKNYRDVLIFPGSPCIYLQIEIRRGSNSFPVHSMEKLKSYLIYPIKISGTSEYNNILRKYYYSCDPVLKTTVSSFLQDRTGNVFSRL